MTNGGISLVDKYRILQNDYIARDKLIIQEFNIGIVAVAILLSLLLQMKNFLMIISLFLVGIVLILTLIISLSKLGRVKNIIENDLKNLAQQLNIQAWNIISQQTCFTQKRKVTNWIIGSMCGLLMVWIVLGSIILYNFA